MGPDGDPETREKYDRLIAEWMANGRRLPRAPEPAPSVVTISVLINEYRKHAERTQKEKQAYEIKLSLRPVRRLYG